MAEFKSIDVQSENLDDIQTGRAAALHVARSVLLGRPGPMQATPSPDAMDMVNVAAWILSGVDPWLTRGRPARRRRWFRRGERVLASANTAEAADG